ncbi:MAG: hypothetical protein U0802_15540 [Candidatus Binatia bacterium]
MTKSAITAVFGGDTAPAASPRRAPPWRRATAPRRGPASTQAVPPIEAGGEGEVAKVDPASLANGGVDPFLDRSRSTCSAPEAPEEAPLSPLQRYEVAQLRADPARCST